MTSQSASSNSIMFYWFYVDRYTKYTPP